MTTTTVLSYVTVDDFRSYIGSDTGNKEDVIGAILLEASREVDAFCGRYFYQQDATKELSPLGLYEIDLGDDDLATTTGLTVTVDFAGNGTWPESRTFGTDYIATPRNQSVNGINGWPFTGLQCIRGKIWPQKYQEYYFDTVKIVGTWGWPAVPEVVKHATKVLAAQRYKMAEAPLGYNAINGWGEVRVKEIPMIASMLIPYQKQSTKFLIG